VSNMREFPSPNIVVSKCLGFDSCRWNAVTIPCEITRKLKPYVNFITVCAEVEIGLGVPRQPIRIVSVEGIKRLVQPVTGNDVTEKMLAFTNSFLASLKDIDGFILKNRSPSCGIKDVKIYPGLERVGALTSKSAGFFGTKVLDMFTGLAIEDEGRLNDFEIREHFLTKLFTLSSFREVKKSKKMHEFISFHTLNKSLLRAYNQKELRILGRIVANPEKKEFEEIINSYEVHLKQAFLHPAKCRANIDVLMHAFGHVSKKLTHEEKTFFFDTLRKYRQGRMPLGAILLILNSWSIRFEDSELIKQTFFKPYPEDFVDLKYLGPGRGLCKP
ncbi:MAG: YbgA family protein, partial [Promethearchaeota archaeon]